jgi:hypothetical protein
MTKAHLAPLLWIGYLVVPVEGWGLFHGRPLGGFDALVLAGLCWLWWVRRKLPLPLLAVVALVAKIALGATLLAPRGFDAKYYANAEFAGAPEKGSEPADRSVTRTDARVSFLGAENGDLPVYFLNDSSRFNFYLPADPVRAALPVSVVWEGWLRVSRTGLRRLYVRSPGGHVTVSLGDGFSATIPPSPSEWTGYPRLQAGFERLRITLSIPQGGARTFEAGLTFDGREEPFDDALVFRRPVSSVRRAADSVLRAVSTAFDAVLCTWLLAGVLSAFRSAWRGLAKWRMVRDAVAIAWTAVIADALLFAWPFLHQMVTLSGGDDWLTYETRARDIGLNNLLMPMGAAIGQGRPFFEMPFYPYFLAATHWLFGDDLYGAHLVQRLLVGGTVMALWLVTAALFGERVGCAGLVAAFVIVYEKVGPWSGVLLTELLFVPLVCFWALQLVKLAIGTNPPARSAAAAGAVGGLATLTRSTLMMGWPFALGLTAISLWPTRRVMKTMTVLVAAMMVVISLATVRNWVVARQFVPINAYGTFNMFLANAPPTPVPIAPEHKAAYERLGLDGNMQTVVEYARRSPGPFFDLWRKRAAYVLGSFATLAPGGGRSIFYMSVSSTALLGLLILILRPAWLPGVSPATFIPLSLALAHGAVLAMTFATVYGDRLLLPFYALLAPYAAIVLFALHRAAWNIAGKGIGWAILAVLLAVAVWWFRGHVPELNVPLLALAVAIWTVCVFGLPRLRRLGVLFYGGAAVIVCIWVAVHGRADIEHAVRMVLLSLVMTISAHGFWQAHA